MLSFYGNKLKIEIKPYRVLNLIQGAHPQNFKRNGLNLLITFHRNFLTKKNLLMKFSHKKKKLLLEHPTHYVKNLYSPRDSTTQSQQCIKDQEVKTYNNIPPKI